MKEEVLAPGGSLDHALWALEGGADAVYVGFQKFSARSHANNLSLDDISALTAVARSKGAHVYCAVNTILGADEVADAVGLAWELHWRGVEALIVQDLGLAAALKHHGPPLDLHASTQAAVHNPGGVAALKQMRFRRVVLARELMMSEIARVVDSDPGMEYEVFVHGALCYAVSGNCMASGLMLGRSANRGDCGQVCRTKFELDYLIPGPHRRESPHEEGVEGEIHAPPGETTWKTGTLGAFASMNDLELGSRIRDLRALGVLSFKIEGRMKPPAYSYNTARAYKLFLEGGRDDEARGHLDEARLQYGRLPSAGWFDGHKAGAQTNPAWAGTLGMPLGTIEAASPHPLVATGSRVAAFRSLAKGDGIMILGTSPGQVFRGALDGPAKLAGAKAELVLAARPTFDPRGGSVWLISRHDGKLPVKKAGRPWRHPVDTQVTLEAGQVTLATGAFGGVTLTAPWTSEPARGDRGVEDSLKDVLTASDSRFTLGHLALENRAGPLFVAPKALKELRRQWYALVEQSAQAFAEQARAAVLSFRAEGSPPPARKPLSPQGRVHQLLGFVVDWSGLRLADLSPTPWGLALPLAPFTPAEDNYFARLRDFVAQAAQDPSVRLFLGLNNPGHLTWLRRLRDEGFVLPHWFADWGFHTANPWTKVQLDGAAPGLAFCLGWLEAPQAAETSFQPPLFTSRACMLRNSFADTGVPQARPRCPDGCAGHFSARLTQGKKGFRVEARDCINYLILEEGS